MKIQRQKALNIILPVMFSIIVSGTVMAKSHDRDGYMHGKLDRLIEYLDLSDEQQEKADSILDELKRHKGQKHAHKKAHYMMTLNPEETGYLDKVNAHADEVAANMKVRIIEMAKAKQALYQILDDEQKQKLAKKNERRLKKIEKRMKD